MIDIAKSGVGEISRNYKEKLLYDEDDCILWIGL